jgi:hypothetical protein
VNQRDYLNALTEIPPPHRAWLPLDPTVDDRAFPLFAYHGFGVLLNSAQEEMGMDVFRRWPPGSIHVLRWANRTGKTTGLTLAEMLMIWRKWRYESADFEQWLGYPYQVLHSAPLNRLMGRAHTLADQLIAGTSDQQKDPRTNRQRPGVLRPFFGAGKSQAKDGSDELWVRCLINNGKVDFLSTQGGAGRMESEKWWFLVWDEFPRQQPVSDVPLLMDQTFLPRSSDFMAPVVLSGTATEDAEPVYGEIEEMAESHPGDWNFSTFDRRANFSQSKASIERQLRLSFDKEAAGRSVEGLSGQAGYGLFPQFAIDNLFTDELPERTPWAELPGGGVGYRAFGSLDHAMRGDENVASTWAVPFPHDRDTLLRNPIIGVEEVVLKSSRTLTPDEVVSFAVQWHTRYKHKAIVVDATAEGGLMTYRALRGKGLPVYPMSYNAKISDSLPPNKDLALQYLQRIVAFGIPVVIDENGYVEAWPKHAGPFGALRLPAAWRRTRRQLTTYKRFDAKLEQDRAMCQAMLAWLVWRLYDGAARPKPQKFNVMARRRRTLVMPRGAVIGGLR